MNWLSKLFGTSNPSNDEDVLWLYVQCNRCGAKVEVRVDRRNEVSADYESGGFVLHKEMMDSKCFQLMHAEIHYDAQLHVTGQTVTNGKFITREEYGNRD